MFYEMLSFVYCQKKKKTTPLTIINKGVLINVTNFIIEINFYNTL